MVPPLWDTAKMREILKQHIPLGELILDDEFFKSRTMREFSPAMDIDEFYENCQELFKLISDEPSGNHADSSKEFGSITKAKQESLSSLSKLNPDIIQVVKIQKLQN